ncbi:MAG: rRNA maturation RNase YbeY [Wujia sp.]
MSVYFENELETPVSDRYEQVVREIIDASLDYFNCPYECEINVIFTDNAGIQEINREHRNIDKPTDVLSFPLIEYEKPGCFDGFEDNPLDYFNQDTGELMFGDIILNLDRITYQAEEYGHSRIRELAFLTAHSMLHLAGYDHIDDDMRVDMETKQEEILNMKGYTRDYEE